MIEKTTRTWQSGGERISRTHSINTGEWKTDRILTDLKSHGGVCTYGVDDGWTSLVGPAGRTVCLRGTPIVTPPTSQRVQRRHTRLTVLVHFTRLDQDLRHLTDPIRNLLLNMDLGAAGQS